MSFNFGGSQQPQYIPPPAAAPPPPPNPATAAQGDVRAAGADKSKQNLGFGSTVATSPLGAPNASTGGKQLTGQ